MTNYDISTIGVRCPYCDFTTPIPSAMIWYGWNGKSTSSGKASFHCIMCGKKLDIKAKRQICDAEVLND